jgi:anti-sigma B factor antagonist
MAQDSITISVSRGRADDTRIVRLDGPLNLQNFVQLKSELAKEQPAVTILDLAGVPYMDSAGMGVIINYYVSAQRRGHKLIASGATPRVMELFELTHVDALIPMTATVEEAERL